MVSSLTHRDLKGASRLTGGLRSLAATRRLINIPVFRAAATLIFALVMGAAWGCANATPPLHGTGKAVAVTTNARMIDATRTASYDARATRRAEASQQDIYYDSMVEHLNGLVSIFEACSDVFDNPWRTYSASAYRSVLYTLRDLRSGAAHGLMPSRVKMGSFQILTYMNTVGFSADLDHCCVEAGASANVAALA